jgi:cysteine peptidase B
VDETIQGAAYKVAAKVLGIQVFAHTGDACKPETIKLPAGAGEIDMKGFSCPMTAGAVELDLDVTLSAAIPSSVARLTIDLTATASSGDKALCVQIKTSPGATDEDRAEFAQWKIQYGKQYANGEEEMRLLNYLENRAKAAKLDAENELATFGVNEFSDLSEEEFAVYHNAGPFYAMPKDPSVPEWPAYSEEEVNKALASDIDWVAKGAVTGVKNQASCGSCWAFSATGNIEGQWKLAGHNLVSVSEQQLVSCDHMGDQGCQGGLPENAFKYVKANGLETEQQYPYTSGSGRTGTCKASGSPAVRVDGQTTVQHNEGQMLAFLQQKGPISIGVDASHFQSYRSGIMTSCNAGQLDHGVLIVGYGTQGSQAYWKIKNSWGKSFGESGYIRVAYNKNCAGLKNDPTSSVVNKATEVVV